jgi:hypothetical protein
MQRSNQYSFLFTLVVFLSTLFTALQAKSDTIMMQQFLSDAPKSWAALKEKYMRGLMVEFNFKVDDNSPTRMRVCIDQNNELNQSSFDSGDDFRESIESVNDNYAFKIKKETSDSVWIMSNVFDDPANSRRHNQFTHGLLLSTPLALSGIMLDDGWLDKLVLSGSFKILSISFKKNDESKKYVEVTFQCQHNLDNNNKILGGSFSFDPDKYWSILDCDVEIEFSVNNASQPSNSVVKTYRMKKYYTYQDVDGYPFPKTVKTIYIHPNRTEIVNQIEYTSVSLEKPPREIFYLSHYGFSELVKPINVVRNIRIILMVIGAILLFVGIYMRFRLNKIIND